MGALPQKNHIVEEKIAEVPKELKKWVKAVKMSKLDKGRLMQRMKNPLSGNPKFIPRIDEIMSLAQARSLSTAAQPLKKIVIGFVPIPGDLAKWVKAVKMSKLDKGRLEQRMKNPLSGNPKLIPRIPEIMAFARNAQSTPTTVKVLPVPSPSSKVLKKTNRKTSTTNKVKTLPLITQTNRVLTLPPVPAAAKRASVGNKRLVCTGGCDKGKVIIRVDSGTPVYGDCRVCQEKGTVAKSPPPGPPKTLPGPPKTPPPSNRNSTPHPPPMGRLRANAVHEKPGKPTSPPTAPIPKPIPPPPPPIRGHY